MEDIARRICVGLGGKERSHDENIWMNKILFVNDFSCKFSRCFNESSDFESKLVNDWAADTIIIMGLACAAA